MLTLGILAAVASALWAGYERGRRVERRYVVSVLRQIANKALFNSREDDSRARMIRADTLYATADVLAE